MANNKAKFADIEFTVTEDESVSYKNNATDIAVENGSSVTDHVETAPISFTISGAIIGDNAADIHAKIEHAFYNKTVSNFVYRSALTNCIITSYNRTATVAYANGFTFSITFKQIKTATKIEVNIDTSKLKIPQIKKLTNAGKLSTTSGTRSDSSLLDSILSRYSLEDQKKLKNKNFSEERPVRATVNGAPIPAEFGVPFDVPHLAF